MREESANIDQTREIGRKLARFLRAGDLVILTGDLGAGKTTLVQGLGEELNVRGRVTSPTYIVSRLHPSMEGGPDLIHVDAYRLGDFLDLETIDLESSLEDSITMVEWGKGKVESLAEEHFEVDLAFKEDDPQARVITITASGPAARDRLTKDW